MVLARWLAVVALAALFPSGAAFAKASVALSYRPILQPGSDSFAAIEIELSFPGDSDGVTDVELPNDWGGTEGLYRQIEQIRLSGARMEMGAALHERVLRHKPGVRITLRYRIRGVERPNQLAAGQVVNEYRPIINAGYFHLLGNAAVPKLGHLDENTPASFRIRGMPKGASFASDMEHAAAGRPMTYGDLLESIAVGGDFRIVKAGSNARLAIRGKFAERGDADWEAAFRKVAGSAAGYWESEPGPYLVTVLAFDPDHPGSTSVGGTGRSDAFAFFSTTNASPDTLDLVMAHEMNHSWMPQRVGGMAEGDGQRESYWLSEGFTDFVTFRGLVRSGVWTPERFAEQMNRVLEEYDGLPVRDMPNREAAKIYWTRPDGQRLPYLRGMLFATRLDEMLRRRGDGRGLRSVLLTMQARAGAMTDAELEAAGHAIGLLKEEAAKAGVPIDDLIGRYIDAGRPIDFADGFAAPCGRLESKVQPRFEVGFDVHGTHRNGDKVIGVVDGNNAWKAGLRNGMTMLGRAAGTPGDSNLPVTYVAEIDGKQKTFTWLPQGEGQEEWRSFRLGDLGDAARRQACFAYLSN